MGVVDRPIRLTVASEVVMSGQDLGIFCMRSIALLI